MYRMASSWQSNVVEPLNLATLHFLVAHLGDLNVNLHILEIYSDSVNYGYTHNIELFP